MFNFFFPGSAQFTFQQQALGQISILSMPLFLLGQGLSLYGYWGTENGAEFSGRIYEGETYLFTPRKPYPSSAQGMILTGNTITLGALFLWGYSQYAMETTIKKRTGNPADYFHPAPNLLLAPFQPRYFLSEKTLLLSALSLLFEITPELIQGGEEFFSRSSVPWMGGELSPAAALGAQALAALLPLMGWAAYTEVYYRGTVADNRGDIASALSGGGRYLGNPVIPGISIEAGIKAGGRELLYGLFAAGIYRDKLITLPELIAARFLSGLGTVLAGYISDPDNPYRITVSMLWGW